MSPSPVSEPHNVQVRDLGLVTIDRDGDETVLNGKAALAISLLVSRFPEAVSRQKFFDVLWDEEGSSDMANSLRVLVHRLRRILGSPEMLPFSGGTYRLDVAPDQIDSVVFEGLVEHAGNHLADGQAAQALQSLNQALSLWRWPSAGADSHSDLHSWQARLDTTRLDAEEGRVQSLLEVGDHKPASIDARRLVGDQPYRERRWELLMLALYRSGRQQEALDAASEATSRLRQDLGVHPRPSLRQLELDILEQATHLDHVRSRASELPLLPTVAGGALLGRDVERATTLAQCEQHQLVALTGPGGIGKTTLALHVAHDLASGPGEVWWCDLSSARRNDDERSGQDPDRSELARRVGVSAGVRNGTDHAGEIAQILSHRTAVTLVLDNCEHVLEDARNLVEKLCAASNITVLITSRRPLDLPFEKAVPLGPLGKAAAAGLFERVARAAAPGAPALDRVQVDKVCDRLDGMPLAIELVARRVRSFSLREIDTHLLALLHEAAPKPGHADRHATMTNAVAWSTDLLTVDARHAAGSASVFHGSFDFDAFAAVVGQKLNTAPVLVLEELVTHGLLQIIRAADHTRYRMLQPIREHALKHVAEQLHTDRDRHLDHYLERLETAYHQQTLHGSEQLGDLIIHEMDNLAAVHEWALENKRFDDDARLYRPLNLAHLYDRPEPFLWAQETVEHPGAQACDRYVEVLHAAWYGALAIQLDVSVASRFATELGDREHEASASSDLAQLAVGLHSLLVEHDYDAAESRFAEVSQDDPYVRYVASTVGASVRLTEASRLGRDRSTAVASANESLRASLRWAQTIGAKNLEAAIRERQAQVMLDAGSPVEAHALAAQSLRDATALGLGHVQAQAQFQLVRCDLRTRRSNADVAVIAGRLADALERAIGASAQARLRWQLPVAAQVLIDLGHHDVAAICIAVGGFDPGASQAAATLSAEELAVGAELAASRNLLDIAALAVRQLRDR